jgi:hypothetical protein
LGALPKFSAAATAEFGKNLGESARAILVRTPRFSGVGFLFILFSQALEDRDFRRLGIFLAPDLATTGSRARSCDT